MSTEYEDMSTSEEERQVKQLSKEQKLDYKEMKDLMTIQGRLKGMIPGFREGIQMQVTGRFPGVPTSEIKKYVVPEEGKRADLHLPPPIVERMSEAHDARIPMRYVNPTPGQRGVTMFIDPELNHDELFEEDLEGNLIQRITLEANKAKELEQKRKREEQEGEGDDQMKKARETTQPSFTMKETTTEKPAPSTSKTATFVPTDILTEDIAEGYLPDDEEESEAETISSTSTADYDRNEAEELVQKISSCHDALSGHYIRLCNLIPHMSKTQLGLYLGKVPFTPLIKAEPGTVKQSLPSEPVSAEEFNPQIKIEGTAEDVLQNVVNQITAERVLFMVAIGDLTINKHSQRFVSKKYNISLSSIQRTLSGDPAHKKGGRQYETEKRKKAKKITTEEETEEDEPRKKKPKKTPGAPTLVQLPEVMEQQKEDDDDELGVAGCNHIKKKKKQMNDESDESFKKKYY